MTTLSRAFPRVPLSSEGPVEQQAPRPPAQRSGARKDALTTYVSTLHNRGEVAELIVALEQHEGGDAPLDPGLAELAARGELDLSLPADRERAILALGLRGERLSARTPEQAPSLDKRDLPALAEALLPVLENARQSNLEGDALPDEVRRAARDALELWQRNLPARTNADALWWSYVRESIELRTVPAYVQAARQLDLVEADPIRGLLFRSPLALAVLFGMLGLVTSPFPISTPFVCLGLALFGAYVAHPYYVRQMVEPLEALAINLAGEEERILRLAGERPWKEEDRRLPGVLADLLPILEGERRAGRTDEPELQQAISAYFDQVAPRWEAEGQGGRYLESMRGLLTGRLSKEFARYAHARAAWEGRWIARILDLPVVSAVFVALVTTPFSWIVSRISPIPPAIDFPAMIALFALLGHSLPRLLPGTLPSRDALLERLGGEQGALESIP